MYIYTYLYIYIYILYSHIYTQFSFYLFMLFLLSFSSFPSLLFPPLPPLQYTCTPRLSVSGTRILPLSLSFPFGPPLSFCVSAFLRALAAFPAVPSSRGSPRFPQDGSGCPRATPALVGTGTTGALPFVPARGSGSGSRRSSLWTPLLPSLVLCAFLSASPASPPPLSPPLPLPA